MKLHTVKADTGHDGIVYSVSWNKCATTNNSINNDKFIMSVGEDKKLYQWNGDNIITHTNNNNNQFKRQLICQLDCYCTCIAFCPSDSFLALGFVDGSLKFLNVSNTNKLNINNNNNNNTNNYNNKNRIGSSLKQTNRNNINVNNSNLNENKIKFDKIIENAHHGAITCLKWNSDGSEIITAGEDGFIKQWSSGGHLRSKLLQCSHVVHSIVWTQKNESIAYTDGNMIGVQSLKGVNSSNYKSIKWNAHDTVILCLDYNLINKCFISGGEDCYYRVWDEFGRLLYSSQLLNYPISQIKWSSNGLYFAVGSNNLILICDYKGWIYDYINKDIQNIGSILSIDWTQDSNQISFGSSHGNIIFGIIVNKEITYKNYIIQLNKSNQIIIRDISLNSIQNNTSNNDNTAANSNNNNNIYEIIDDISDNIINFSVNFDYLILITTKKCHIYNLSNVSTPNIFSLAGISSNNINKNNNNIIYFICQTNEFFILVSNLKGIEIIDYQGNLITQIRSTHSLKPKLLNNNTLTCSNNIIAIINTQFNEKIQFYDTSNGKLYNNNEYIHNCEIIKISISPMNNFNDTNIIKIAFIDSNKDLYLLKIDLNENINNNNNYNVFKLCTIVDSMMWHPTYNILICLSDKILYVWYYPSIIWCDPDLLKLSYIKIDATNAGLNCKIISIQDTIIYIKKANGIKIILRISSLPLLIYESIYLKNDWNKALRLCYASKNTQLWCLVAGLAFDQNNINAALQALTALDEPDKFLFIKRTSTLPIPAHKEAEIALYKRNSSHAEQILLSNGLIYRAIELNIRLFRWQNALKLAMKNKVHIDTVLAFRNHYLQANNLSEGIELFKQYESRIQEFDLAAVDQMRLQEIQKEYSQNNMPIETMQDFLFELAPSDEPKSNKKKSLQDLLNIEA